MILPVGRFGGLERLLTAAALLALVACSDRSPTAPQDNPEKGRASPAAATLADRFRRPTPRVIAPRGDGVPLSVGVWGGERAELIVTENAATIKLFCAHGASDHSILYDADGRFSAPGWLVREVGPVASDDTPFRRPALYSGRTVGQVLTLTVFVDNSSLGPFTLIHGQKGNLGSCPIL